MDRVRRGQTVHGHGVARLVDGGEPPLLLADDAAALFRTGDDLHHGLFQIGHDDDLPVFPGSQQRRLVEEVGQVRAGESGGGAGNHAQVHRVGQGLILGVDFQNGFAAMGIGCAHINLPVETAGTQQCRVQNVLPVGGRHDNDALVFAEAVHFHQQLVQRLFPLVVTAAHARASAAADGVDFVDEDDGRGQLLGLIEQIPDTAGADAHIQLHEVGAGDGQKLDVGLTGHGPGQQCFTGAGRAHQQYALGNAGAQGGKALGVLEEFHQLLELGLFLVSAGHIVKGDRGVLIGADAGVGPAKPGHAAATAAVGPVHHKEPDHDKQNAQQQIRQDGDDPRQLRGRLVLVSQQDAVGLLLPDQIAQIVVEDAQTAQLMLDLFAALIGLVQLHGEHPVLDGKGLDLLLLKERHHLGVVFDLRRAGGLEQGGQGGKEDDQNQGVEQERHRLELSFQCVFSL